MVHIAVQNKRRGRMVQKKIVEHLGGKNVGTLGGEDGMHDIWSIEAKGLRKFVGEKHMLQCERNCPKGKTPLLVVHVIGQRYHNDLVIMRRKDWEEWFGKLNSEAKEEDD
jgi:hypothetical protein